MASPLKSAKISLLILFLISTFSFGVEDASVWEEKFEELPLGPLLIEGATGGRWYMDAHGGGGPEGYEIIKGSDEKNLLAISQLAAENRLGLILGKHNATENEGNCVAVEFRDGEESPTPLLLTVFADNGSTQVASLKFDMAGAITLYRDREFSTPNLLPITWAVGEWNRVEIITYPEKKEVVIHMKDSDGTVTGEFSAPLVRSDDSSIMPWYVIHFAQGNVSKAPWLVRAVTIEDRKKIE